MNQALGLGSPWTQPENAGAQQTKYEGLQG